MNYANKLSISYVILLGEEEENNITIYIKDMKSGIQEIINFQDIN
ncbi:hypothetical protein [Clostridium sp.]|nr:hypothetical protein [Clostridium sp.]